MASIRIEIDPASGFCFGVHRVAQAAENALQDGKTVHILGEMVHNPEEIKRLESLGIQTISKEQLLGLEGKTLVIRAHGEPPETFHTIASAGIDLVDGTCPIVNALQKKIRNTRNANPDIQIVIYGKTNHPEVIGLNGGIGYSAIIVDDENAGLDHIDFQKPVVLFCQTTQSEQGFLRLAERMKNRMDAAGVLSGENLQIHNTICRQVSQRVPALRQFAAGVDVVVFVSGSNSSNGKYLFGVCKEVNPNSFRVQNPQELDRAWFEKASSVGISGATSTPVWQLEQVRAAISAMVSG